MVGFDEGGMERVRARMLRPAEDVGKRRGRGVRGERGAQRGQATCSDPFPDASPDAFPDVSPEAFPDPFDDPDTIAELEDRILVLSTHIEVAGHRLLQLVAEFDKRRGWELGGHASCAHWLAARAGLDRGTAR
ncbi:MAG: hypothetical protein WEA09_14975, partial [Gemmatimonadota bacterium]